MSSLSQNLVAIFGFPAFLGSIAYVTRRISGYNKLHITAKEPFSVQKDNWILFDRITIKHDNEKLLYSGTHVARTDVCINGDVNHF